MADLKYVLKRLKDLNWKQMLEKINNVRQKTGMSRLRIFNDMRRCAVLYGAGYMDYDLFEMYNLTDEQRDTYLTRGRNNAIVVKYCDKSVWHLFQNKKEFNALFADYVKREWISPRDASKEEVLDFIARHEVFMAKPDTGGCGRGIEKIHRDDYASVDELYDYLVSSDQDFELEEVIIQHPAVAAINPYSINTVRLVTLLTTEDGESFVQLPEEEREAAKAKLVPHVITTFFRIGTGKKCVDNFNSGGMCAPVDVETGTVLEVAIDKKKNVYTHHPETGTAIKGFTFPDWEQAKAMCLDAAMRVPEMGYVGWDIGFTPDGPILVEGNEFPGHDIYQLPVQTPDKIGMMPRFDFSYMKKDKEVSE